jgi:hypothetical protein
MADYFLAEYPPTGYSPAVPCEACKGLGVTGEHIRMPVEGDQVRGTVAVSEFWLRVPCGCAEPLMRPYPPVGAS